MKSFGHKFFDLLVKVRKEVVIFFKSNVLFTAFVISSLINGILLRFFTVKNILSISPIFADVTFILLVGSFGYFIKPKHRFKYYITWSIILMLVCLINSIYYTNYISFTSFSLLSTASFLGDMDGAVITTLIHLKDVILIMPVIILPVVHIILLATKYYDKIKKKTNGNV